jgi:hypothetical protein
MKLPSSRTTWLVYLSLLACLSVPSFDRGKGDVTEVKSRPSYADRNSSDWRREVAILKAQYYPTVRCITPQGVCFLQGSAPPGTPCWCASVYGPVAGRVG